jgi:ATP-binding cassette subfamily C protein
MLQVARTYPSRTLITLMALLIAGVAQGIGLSAILPVLSMATQEGVPDASTDTLGLLALLRRLGVDPSLGVLLGLIVLGITLKNALVLFANSHVGNTVAQIATDLRLRLLRALLDARWDYFLHQPVGTLTNAMATESTRAAAAYLSGARATALAVETLAYLSVALTISWRAALTALALGAVVVVSFGRLVRSARRAGGQQTRFLTSLMSSMTDMLQSVKALKSMGMAGQANLVLEAETGRLNRALRKEVLSNAALPALQESVVVAFVASGLYFAVTRWQLPLANIMVLVLLLVRVLNTLGKIQQHYQKMVVGESAYWSMQRTIRNAELAEEAADEGQVPRFERELVLDDLHAAFGDKPVLRGVSLRLPVGSFTTLIGPSGAGKTTVLDLITGLIQPSSGTVLIDGLPLQKFSLRQWRRLIGYVPQETLLLHDTVLHNVTLGDPGLTPGDAEAALRAAGAWDFVSAMPEGILTPVGERGSKLSGGQRQRLSIARALARRPKLLILDEATSALDPESEAALCETLAGLKGSLTVLAVSHQAGLTTIADRVMQLTTGTVAPAGLPDPVPGP